MWIKCLEPGIMASSLSNIWGFFKIPKILWGSLKNIFIPDASKTCSVFAKEWWAIVCFNNRKKLFKSFTCSFSNGILFLLKKWWIFVKVCSSTSKLELISTSWLLFPRKNELKLLERIESLNKVLKFWFNIWEKCWRNALKSSKNLFLFSKMNLDDILL